MSGFEIAGVVLGSFPLLISACEHYKQGFEPLLKWKRFRIEFMGFIDAVDAERLLFDQMLETFLISTDAVDHDELRRFMVDPDYEGWKRKDIDEALQKRLGPSLAVYNSTIKAMHKLVQDLQDLLLLKNGQVNWASEGASRWDYQMKRVQLSFSKKGTRTLAALESHNRKLRELLDSNEKLESVKASQKDTSWANIFDSIRKHASSIHAAIKLGFCCTCSPHVTALRLEQRKTGDSSSSFNVAFTIPKLDQARSSRRREVVVRVRNNKASDEISSTHSAAVSQGKTPSIENSLTTIRYHLESKSTPQLVDKSTNSRPPLTSSLSGSLRGTTRTKFRDRFSKSPTNSSSSLGSQIQEDVQTLTLNPIIKAKKQVRLFDQNEKLAPIPCIKLPTDTEVCHKINDLCSTLQAPDPTVVVLGFLCDGQREFELRAAADVVNYEDSYISLESLLLGQGDVTLSRQERYKLASILASSLLQLQTTPWLVNQIDKKNVFFYRQGNRVVVEHPYIKHAFVTTIPQTTNPSNPVEARFAVRNTLNNLGILLLELCFGQTIETQKLRIPYLGPDGKANGYTDFMTARDWVDSVAGEDPEFEPIVSCCISCHFDEKADWENKRFTQAVHASVVAPLEKLNGNWRVV